MWYLLRKEGKEIKTDTKKKAEALQKGGYKLMSVVDPGAVSGCKEG